ncbi:hypothetical protein ACCO45_008927 [Purpureocillium lilacinum]|uniref:Uncharacterized protein n=1 Tax=Purpureocillium lilacinum TaxID=33203 RepID=A0ACC4DKW8_PURLI
MSCDERQRQRQGISIKHWLLQMRIIRFMRTRRFALPVWVRRELPPLVGNLGCATAAPPLPSFAQGAAPVPLREPAPGMPGAVALHSTLTRWQAEALGPGISPLAIILAAWLAAPPANLGSGCGEREEGAERTINKMEGV